MLEIQVCYHSKKDRKSFISKIIENHSFGFTPEIMDIDYNEKSYNKERALKLVQKSDRDTGIIFKTNDESFEMTIGFMALIEGSLNVTWTIKNNEFKEYQFLIPFITEEYFISAYVYDYKDVYWQSETSISEYEINNKDHKNLKKIRDKWDELVIDVSSNYGRKELLKNTSLCASPKMWFSNLFFEITGIDKNKILELPNIKKINDNVLEINLFEDVFKTNNLENRTKQKEFWEYANYDMVIKKLYPY